MQHSRIQAIDKTKVNRLSFYQGEVLLAHKDQRERDHKLRRALALGNLYKHHVRIKFMSESYRTLETVATIWAVTEEYVLLKGGAAIPIRCILDIENY